jgi:CMP-N,N'-diacetyllegionaminic acid synthase
VIRVSSRSTMLAIIPARRGSRGLPGKNIRPFAGLPLIAHSILFTRMCPEIDRCIVSTEDPEIADVARRFGAEVPFMRPADMAQDNSPIFPVLRHALQVLEKTGSFFDYVTLLEPTTPAREPNDVASALELLKITPSADGIVSVSQPYFNPIWTCVVNRDGWMADLISVGSQFDRRQDVPSVFRINGALYIWRAEFIRKHETSWRNNSKHLMYKIPEMRAMSIDSLDDFKHAELMVKSGLVRLPWAAYSNSSD